MKQVNWFLFLIILFTSCEKEKEFDYPLIYTGEVTNNDGNGATFNGKIAIKGNDSNYEYGFVWDTEPNPTIEKSEKIAITNVNKNGIFNKRIITDLDRSFIYYVRAYIKNQNYISYGNEVSFECVGSAAPEIIDYFPKTANLNDTVLIIGKNFSKRPLTNKVSFNSFFANVIKCTNDSIWVVIPNELNIATTKLSVSIQGKKSIAKVDFNLIVPIILDFNNKVATFGDEITIIGNNFLENSETLIVFFGIDGFNYFANIVSLENEKIVVQVPNYIEISECNIKVRMNNITITSEEVFKIKSIVINDINPKIANAGDEITIIGSNFHPLIGYNIVKIDGIQCEINDVTSNSLTVTLPLQKDEYYSSRNVEIEVTRLGETQIYNEKLLINNKWFRLKDSPISFSNNNLSQLKGSVRWVTNNEVYILMDNSNLFYKYIPENNEWIQLSNFTGIPRTSAIGFIVNNKLYYGTGSSKNISLNDIWEYNIETNNWIQKNNFIGANRERAIAFEKNNIGYIGLGLHKTNLYPYTDTCSDIWKYDDVVDTWTKITDYPTISTNGTYSAIALVSNNYVYIGLGVNSNQRIYKFDVNDYSWNRIADYPKNDFYPVGFYLNGTNYISTLNASNYLYTYNESLNSWGSFKADIISNFDSNRNRYSPYEIAFCIGNKGYIGFRNELWEYDPSR